MSNEARDTNTADFSMTIGVGPERMRDFIRFGGQRTRTIIDPTKAREEWQELFKETIADVMEQVAAFRASGGK